MELKTGMQIKIFPETDAEAYTRMINDYGFKAHVYRDHITVGPPRKTPKLDTQKLGELIKRKRKSADLTRAQLADWLEIKEKNIFEWEIGRKQPRRDVMRDLKIILNIKEEELNECRI